MFVCGFVWRKKNNKITYYSKFLLLCLIFIFNYTDGYLRLMQYLRSFFVDCRRK